MIDYLTLPLGDKAPEVVNVVVEIPLQSINKYEYDKKLHVFRLDRNLYSAVHFPGDYDGDEVVGPRSDHNPNSSLRRLVCARLTGSSVCLRSSIRSW